MCVLIEFYSLANECHHVAPLASSCINKIIHNINNNIAVHSPSTTPLLHILQASVLVAVCPSEGCHGFHSALSGIASPPACLTEIDLAAHKDMLETQFCSHIRVRRQGMVVFQNFDKVRLSHG